MVKIIKNQSNLGKNGSSPIQYNKILKIYNKNTRVVIYGFYEGNNLYKILPIPISETKKNITKKNIKYSIKKIFGYSINLNLIYANYYKYMKSINIKNCQFQVITMI